jgi:hypothetical protein
MKDSAKAVARVYLPVRSEEPASLPPSATPSALAASAPAVSTSMSLSSIPPSMGLRAGLVVE